MVKQSRQKKKKKKKQKKKEKKPTLADNKSKGLHMLS
jgi:hypothetical protein